MVEQQHKPFTKKRVALFAAVTLFAASLGLFLVANLFSASVPSYQGKSAREWLYPRTAVGQVEKLTAFEEMGSNAIPFLVHELARKDSSWEKFCRWSHAKLPASISRYISVPPTQAERMGAAYFVLDYLKARSAIPLLLPILSEGDEQQQWYALALLKYVLGPDDIDCKPPVLHCLKAKDYRVCIEAGYALQRMDAANDAIPALTNLLKSPSRQIRQETLHALGWIDVSNNAKWTGLLAQEQGWPSTASSLPRGPSLTNAPPMPPPK